MIECYPSATPGWLGDAFGRQTLRGNVAEGSEEPPCSCSHYHARRRFEHHRSGSSSPTEADLSVTHLGCPVAHGFRPWSGLGAALLSS
jgi:hypothetical protein